MLPERAEANYRSRTPQPRDQQTGKTALRPTGSTTASRRAEAHAEQDWHRRKDCWTTRRPKAARLAASPAIPARRAAKCERIGGQRTRAHCRYATELRRSKILKGKRIC